MLCCLMHMSIVFSRDCKLPCTNMQGYNINFLVMHLKFVISSLLGGGCQGCCAQGRPLPLPRAVQLLPPCQAIRVCPGRTQVQECQTEDGWVKHSMLYIVSCLDPTLSRGSLLPWPHPLTRKRIWWLLSNFLVVPTQQYWLWTEHSLHACVM